MGRYVKRWMKLDNAAKIYPASQSRRWMALFRLSAQLTEPVNPVVLQEALAQTLGRFPAFSQRLRSGLFWNYMEYIHGVLEIQPDVRNPCVKMRFRDNNGFMLRVRYFDKRIAVEFFHVLTDGTGGLCFLKTLVAEYLTIQYGIKIPRSKEILNCNTRPSKDELEDGFLKYARDVPRSRREKSAYYIPGTRENHYINITTGIMDVAQVLKLAKSYKVTLTEFLASVMIMAIESVQMQKNPNRKKHKPVKIGVPINLRKYYGTNTMRNFASYINPGIEPKYGEYSLSEITKLVHGYMAIETDEKLLNAKFSTNVLSEQNLFLRIAPLFLKKPAMKFMFHIKGDRQTSTTISNLGVIKLPAEMEKYVTRVDFLLGPLVRNRIACGCTSYDGKLIFNITRTIQESEIERNFFTALVKMGIHVSVESNQRREDSCHIV